MPPLSPAFAPAFGCVGHRTGYPPQRAVPGFNAATCAQRSSLRMGYVVPPLIAWRPHPPVCTAPPHFPAAPVIDAVLGIQGSSCLLHRPSELSPLHCPELPPSASAGSPNTCASVLPYQHWPSGRCGKPLATPRCPPISFVRARSFGVSFVRSRYGPPGCSPPALTRPERLCVLSASRGFYFRAFRSPGRPVCLPDITTASN